MLRYVGNFITDIWSSSLHVHLYTCNICRFLFIFEDISFLIHLKLNKYQLNNLAVLIVLFKTYVVLDLNKTYQNVFFFDGSNFYSWSSLWFPCLIIFDMKSKKVKIIIGSLQWHLVIYVDVIIIDYSWTIMIIIKHK